MRFGQAVALSPDGRLALVGDGQNRIDTTYIDNAAQAHFDAFDALAPGAACAGRAYFISNGEPKTTRETINGLLAAAGVVAFVATSLTMLVNRHDECPGTCDHDLVAAADYLDAHSVHYVYANYWTAMPLTYLSGGRVIAASIVGGQS